MSAGFQCKQFYVAHDQCAMKVGTDALILGAWASLPVSGAMMDIGAGSGILSLMLAQRSQSGQKVTAIELDAAAAAQAADNFAASRFAGQLSLIQGDILTYQPSERYALIVSNPPFFQASLPSSNPQRQQARHNDSLPFAALLSKAADLLADNGAFELILPPDSAEQLCELALQSGWQLQRRTRVYSLPGKPLRRVLLSLKHMPDSDIKAAPEPADTELIIQHSLGGYTEQYRQLLREFYLKF